MLIFSGGPLSVSFVTTTQMNLPASIFAASLPPIPSAAAGNTDPWAVPASGRTGPPQDHDGSASELNGPTSGREYGRNFVGGEGARFNLVDTRHLNTWMSGG